MSTCLKLPSRTDVFVHLGKYFSLRNKIFQIIESTPFRTNRIVPFTEFIFHLNMVLIRTISVYGLQKIFLHYELTKIGEISTQDSLFPFAKFHVIRIQGKCQKLS